MSILTEKQIAKITFIALNQSTSRDLYEELCEWNEKQLSFNVNRNVNWDDAPKWAETATIVLKWVGAGNLENVILERHERPEPVITPHPHAKLMMKYAEVAARRVDPWSEFEFRSMEGRSWEKPTTLMSFYVDWQYRYIGEQQ